MLTYEVTADVTPDVADAYERYMRERHLADVLATGCFSAATLERTRPGAYRVRYVCRTRAELDRYLAEHAAALRAHFAATLPTGVRVAREVWEEVAHVEAAAPAGPAAGG